MSDFVDQLDKRVERKGQEEPFWSEEGLIHSYTRAQAIEDGFLVDVSETAREAGLIVPVAVTAAVWAKIENIPPKTHQDIQGRLWDVVWMGRWAVRRRPGRSSVCYRLRMDRNERGRRLRNLDLRMTIGPGDDGEAAITIMLPEED